MLGRNHLVTTTAIGTLVAYNLYSQYPELAGFIGVGLAGVVAGSLLPDIDHTGSKIGRKIPIVSHIISFVFGHRGFTHSFLFVFLLFAPAVFITHMQSGQEALFYSSFFAGLSFGALMHIFEDMLTYHGVPLFWPCGKRVSMRLFATGGIIEHIVTLSIVAISIMFIWRSM